MKISLSILTILVLILSHLVAAAEDAYVIDKLLVGVHQDQDLDSAIIKVLPTGTKLEVIKLEGELALIKDPEGTSGWVDAAYLMEEVPASIRLKALTDENAALSAKLNAPASPTASANAATSAERDELTNENTELKGKLSAEILKSGQLQSKIGKLETEAAERASTPADTRIAELEVANKALSRDLESTVQTNQKLALRLVPQSTSSDPTVVIGSYSAPVLVGFGIAILLAFGAGAYLIDYLNRRRHGGFRV